MGRTLQLESLNEDKSKLLSELEEKQNTLATLTKEIDELKAKQDRVSLRETLSQDYLQKLLS